MRSDSGASLLRKVFPTGEVAAWEHERDALERARGHGVPALVRAGHDDADRPFLELAWVGDEDTRALVGRHGPLPAHHVLDLGTRAAAILERLHALPLVHGDIKPANLVRSDGGELYVVDFEHAVSGPPWVASELSDAFTGGTHGFAPPEAYLGHGPSAAFDLYGLGATLHYLLTGFAPTRPSGEFDGRLLLRLRPTLPSALLRLLVALLDTRPSRRPPAAQARATLSAVAPPDAALERTLLAGGSGPPAGEGPPLALRRHWRQKLTRVLDSGPQAGVDAPVAKLVEDAIELCRAMHLCMSFLPLHPLARERLGSAQSRLPDLLHRLPGEVQRLRQNMELVEARHLARLAVDLCRIVSVLNLPDRDAPFLIESVGHALQTALNRVDHEEAQQRTILARLEQAEADLDLDRARAILAELLDSFSGANEQAARMRDRFHRFLWLLERVVAGRPGVDEAGLLLRTTGTPRLEGTRLLQFLDRAEGALHETLEETHTSLSLLARVMRELSDSHPKLRLTAAADELASLRLALTERAIVLLNGMAERLRADPVPLRPLLRELVEADRILMLDCLVDSPRMTRSELLDRLQQLRLRIEEVSDQHRRIAEGAREHMDQGRLTTALYDLERALEASQAGEDGTESGEIRKELEKVRRLREEVRVATRRNLELAELHARLAMDPARSLEERLACLTQREEVLRFLLEVGPQSFRPRYRTELTEIRQRRVRDIAEDAEETLRATPDPGESLRIARETLSTIDRESPDAPPAALVKRWQAYRDQAERELDAHVHIERQRRTARRRRQWLLVAAIVVAAAFGAYLLS